MSNGVIIVGEYQDNIEGMLIAHINHDPWLPEVKVLREMAWWVEPPARSSTLGYKLLRKYIEYGEKMKQHGVIDEFMLTLMEISPDFDLEKRGWNKVEHNYVFEGA